MDMMKFYVAVGSFLSLIAFGEVYTNAFDAYGHPYVVRMGYSSPIIRDTYAQLVVERDKFLEKKAPVPYYQFWNNKLGQTAQQMVAICYVLQKELRGDCLKETGPILRVK